MTTPAEELRHAAAHLRITAIGATDDTGTDTWTTRRTSPTGTTQGRHTLSAGPGKRLVHGTAPGPAPWVTRHVGEYIALMSPAVGLALADWLKQTLRAVEEGRIAIPAEALAIARAINGEQP